MKRNAAIMASVGLAATMGTMASTAPEDIEDTGSTICAVCYEPGPPLCKNCEGNMTQQTVSVTILPGPFSVYYSDDALVITDTRGGVNGWMVYYDGFSIKPRSTMQDSASGITVGDKSITKDGTIGPHGSTGGGYVFDVINPEEWKRIEISAPDLVTQTISFRGDAGQIIANVVE